MFPKFKFELFGSPVSGPVAMNFFDKVEFLHIILSPFTYFKELFSYLFLDIKVRNSKKINRRHVKIHSFRCDSGKTAGF
jgi:hypothetical protein